MKSLSLLSLLCLGFAVICPAAFGQDAPDPVAQRLARNRDDARALAKSIMPEPPGTDWHNHWDTKLLSTMSEDEHWAYVFIAGIADIGVTEAEARSSLADLAKASSISERQAAICMYQTMAADFLPSAQRDLLVYNMRGILDALGRDQSIDYKDFQRRSVTELCALDDALSDEQARDRFVKLATLPTRRTCMVFDKCNDWTKAGNFTGPQLAENGVQVCEATVEIIIINPSRTAEIVDPPAADAPAMQARLKQAYQKLITSYVDYRNSVIVKIEDLKQRDAARKKLAEVESAAMNATITVTPRNVGTGGHLVYFANFAAPPSPNVTFFNPALAPEPSWGGFSVILPYGCRSLFGPPERVCIGWFRNGSALVQVTLEGNLSEEAMVKETDLVLSTLSARTDAYNGMDAMLKSVPESTKAPKP